MTDDDLVEVDVPVYAVTVPAGSTRTTALS